MSVELARQQRPAGPGLLAALAPADLARLQGVARSRCLEAGDTLYRQGAVAVAGYLLTDGRAAVLVHGQRVSEVEAGAFVGDADVLGRQPYRTSVVVTAPTTVWEVDAQALDRLLGEAPTFARALARDLGSRLRAAEITLHVA